MLHIGFEVIGKKEDVKRVQDKLLELPKRHDVLLDLSYKFNDDKVVTVKPLLMSKSADFEEFKQFNQDFIDITDTNFISTEFMQYV